MRNKESFDRRYFFKLAGLTATVGLATSLTGVKRIYGKSLFLPDRKCTAPPFHPVNVSADRVIREIAGLRPYRPSGFVLKTEKIGRKLFVHNYGHGGAGISLSWGTATMAADLIQESTASHIAVAGCGIIGLSTARILQRRGFRVTIYTRDLPPETTSSVACGLWSPGSVYEEKMVGNEFLNSYYMASEISQRVFQDYVGDKYGVKWINNYFLGSAFHFPGGRKLYNGFLEHRDAKGYFGYAEVDEVVTMMIETPVYLNALLEDFYLAGGNTVIKTFKSAHDFKSLHEKIIMNCTGLGSGKLFNDTEIIPVKGQLTILLPQPEITYSYVAHMKDNLLYMFPRKDGIVLGGTYDKGNWSFEPDKRESERIMKGHSVIADSLKEFRQIE